MARTYKVTVAGERQMFVDAEPLPSARLFKFVSDAVLQRDPAGARLGFAAIELTRPPATALDMLRETLRQSDPDFKRAFADDIVSSYEGNSAGVTDDELCRPAYASLQSVSYDAGAGHDKRNYVDRDGQARSLTFIDGHRDYDRDLSLDFQYGVLAADYTLTFSLQRHEAAQAYPTDITGNLRFKQLEETGYDGTIIYERHLSVPEETAVLKLFAKLGGISLDSFETSDQ